MSRPSTTEVDPATRFERRRALRALLRNPLLGADAAAFPWVRKHADWLREWLGRHPEWRLEIDTEHARLRKIPADLDDGTRAALEPRDGMPFSRRRYVLFCLALAALERSERQTTLGRMAEDIARMVRGDEALGAAGIVFDLDTRDQRRDLVQVARTLLRLGVIVRIHGDEQQFLDRKGGDALYSLRRPLLAALLTTRRAPSTVPGTELEERLRQLMAEPNPETAEGRNRRIRSRLTRALLDDPVLYFDTLDADELAYFQSQWVALSKRVEEATGMVREHRREGIAMVDERGDVTDLGLPEEGTDGHLALLLAEHLAQFARQHPGHRVGRAALEQFTARQIAEHASHWAKRVREPGAETHLLTQTLDRLAALRLVRLHDDGVEPRPAIGRFALARPDKTAKAPQEVS